MAIIGYARVSTKDQDLDLQVDNLKHALDIQTKLDKFNYSGYL